MQISEFVSFAVQMSKMSSSFKARTSCSHTVGTSSTPPRETHSCAVRNSVTKKSRDAARLWQERWGFYSQIRNIQEEEAQKIGMSLEEYRAALRSVSCHPEPRKCPVEVDPSPTPLPPTTSGTIGRRAQCPLERYGKLVKTSVDYPTRPPLKPDQLYDPYKQTFIFLGSVVGDPISYKLPISRCEVTDEMWARSQQLSITPLGRIEEALRDYNNHPHV